MADTFSPAGYRSLAKLNRDLARCRACVAAGQPLPVTSWPVMAEPTGQRAYLFGLAPGAVESAERRPWRGRAGATIRAWLRLDEEAFYATFYCASITRCYPGRAAAGRGDRTATRAERELCARWHTAELQLLHPGLVVTVGLVAAQTVLGVRTLTDAVGKSYLVDDAIVIPLPHPSGASGWLNGVENRARLGKALTHVRRELERLADE